MIDVELTTVGVLAFICHSKAATDVVEIRANLIFKAIARVNALVFAFPDGLATAAVPIWVTGLDDEVVDNTVESQIVLVAFLGVREEVFHSERSIFWKELDGNIS